MLMRLLCIGAVVFLLAKGTKLGREQMQFVFNISGNVTTRAEVGAIARQICVDFVTDAESHGIPDESDEFWADYIRKNMKTPAKAREAANDIWGTPYRVRKTGDAGDESSRGFSVRSAGPDKKFGTGDDIVVVNGQ